LPFFKGARRAFLDPSHPFLNEERTSIIQLLPNDPRTQRRAGPKVPAQPQNFDAEVARWEVAETVEAA
jgi:hypothetical protein